MEDTHFKRYLEMAERYKTLAYSGWDRRYVARHNLKGNDEEQEEAQDGNDAVMSFIN